MENALIVYINKCLYIYIATWLEHHRNRLLWLYHLEPRLSFVFFLCLFFGHRDKKNTFYWNFFVWVQNCSFSNILVPNCQFAFLVPNCHFLLSWCQISGCKIVLPLTNWLVNTNTGVFNLLPKIYGSRTRWWTHQGIGRYLESILTKKWHTRVHNDISCFVLLAHSPHLPESAMLLPSENDNR